MNGLAWAAERAPSVSQALILVISPSSCPHVEEVLEALMEARSASNSDIRLFICPLFNDPLNEAAVAFRSFTTSCGVLTLTEKLHDCVLFDASLAVHVTVVVVPIPNVLPDA